MVRRWARRMERTCCTIARYLPLAFVYGATTWAVWVVVTIGSESVKSRWIGTTTSSIGVALYILLNWSYTTAVFTDPGSTTNNDGYGILPTNSQSTRKVTSFTVKSNGEMRFCKKCQARKPDRAHHCSTCRRCVLKMDHHCPWLATCVGLHNYKAFLLFLIYTTIFCFYCFAISGSWFWVEVLDDPKYLDTLMPVNFIMLAVMSGIIGIAVGAFATWHVMLSCRGQTTIECLEKTRYLASVRNTYNQAHDPANGLPQAARQFVDFHTNALPGITRPEEGEERRSQDRPRVQLSYDQRERQQTRKRYEDYLDEQDSEKLPNAFDLGWKENLLHLMGPKPIFWVFPVCNTTGDGWAWEASPKWADMRERLHREREQQRLREVNAGWGDDTGVESSTPDSTGHYHSRAPLHQAPVINSGPRKALSKADRILGRDPNLYADGTQDVAMRRLNPRGRTVEEELEDLDNDDSDVSDLEAGNGTTGGRGQPSVTSRRSEAERQALNVVTNGNGRGWGRGGASGMLSKNSPRSVGSSHGNDGTSSPRLNDDGVD